MKKIQNNKNTIKIFIIFVLFAGFVNNVFAFISTVPGASTGEGVKYNLIQPLPGVQSVAGFPDYVKKIIPFILGLAAVIAVIKIVWAGIKYATSLGNDSTIKEAKEDITQAILGLVLAISSYLILNTINPDLVNLNFGPTAINIEAEKSVTENLCKKCGPTDQCKIQNNAAICIPIVSAGQ